MIIKNKYLDGNRQFTMVITSSMGGSPNNNKSSKSPVRVPQIVATSKLKWSPIHRKELDNKIE